MKLNKSWHSRGWTREDRDVFTSEGPDIWNGPNNWHAEKSHPGAPIHIYDDKNRLIGLIDDEEDLP